VDRRGNNGDVPPWGLLRPKRSLRFGKNPASPHDARRALERALAEQEKRVAASLREVVDVQLLGQVTPSAEWPKLFAYWERRKPSWTDTWPRHLDPGASALNLWPLPAGRVGRAADLGGDVRKRQPNRVLATPGVTVFDARVVEVSTAFAGVCAIWLEHAGIDFTALRLAPPVLEAWARGGRLVTRDVVDFDLDWSLPPADAI
jgi:hypothetical protein